MQQFQFIFCEMANRFKCTVYTYTQILLYLGDKLQSLVIMMSSCSAQCIPCSTGSGWVEIIRRICIVLSRLTSNSLEATMKTEGDRGSTRSPKKTSLTRGSESWSDVNSYSICHIRRNSSLILRCKTIFHEVVPKCPHTSPVPKCPRYEVSVHLSCRWFVELSWVMSILTSRRYHWRLFVTVQILQVLSWNITTTSA